MATPVDYHPPHPAHVDQRAAFWGRVAHRAIESSRGRPSFVPPSIRDGIGQIAPYELSSPSMAVWRRALTPSQQAAAGMGQNGEALYFGLTAGMLAAIVVVAGVVNYQLGKAMAPNGASESKWAWGNAIGGTLFPPFTLGMAVYKNYIR